MTAKEIYDLLVSNGVSPSAASTLVATAKSESGLNAGAVGDGGDSIGLFQINIPAHRAKLQALSGSNQESDWIEWLKDPVNNTLAAIAVFNSQGLGAWTEYKNGHYLNYLGLENTDTTITGTDSSVSSSNYSNLPGDSISPANLSVWDKLKNKALDAWYYAQGTTKQAANYPTYQEIYDAKTQYNEDYGLDLDTTNETAALDYIADKNTSVYEKITIAALLLIIIIVGILAFFKAFDVSSPFKI